MQYLAGSLIVLSEVPLSDWLVVGFSVAACDGVWRGFGATVAESLAGELLALSLRSALLGWVFFKWSFRGQAWVLLGWVGSAWADVGPGVDVVESCSLELDVGVDSLVAKFMVRDELDFVDVLAVSGNALFWPGRNGVDGSSGLDEVDCLVETDVDGVLGGEPVAVGDVVQVSLNSDVEAILAGPAVGHLSLGGDVGTVGGPLARFGGRGGGDESGDLHF